MRLAKTADDPHAWGARAENLEGAHAALAMGAVFIVFLCLFSAALTAAILPGKDRPSALASARAPEPIRASYAPGDGAPALAARRAAPSDAAFGPRASQKAAARASVSAPTLYDLRPAARASARRGPAPLTAADRRFANDFVKDIGPARRYLRVSVAPGETLGQILLSNGVAPSEAEAAVMAVQERFDLRGLRAGDLVKMATIAPALSIAQDAVLPDGARGAQLASLKLRPTPETRILLTRTDDGFSVRERPVELTRKDTRAHGVINSSLYLAALDAGMPDASIVEFMNVFTYDIDFQRQVRKGDSFEAVFARLYDEDGTPVKSGSLLFAEMTIGGAAKAYYRFETPDDGRSDYYDVNGKSAKKFLMKTPISGARLTSGFGARRHPVLGYTQAHKGVDFSAKRGTPVMAAGDGVVERASPFGTFGHYVRIRHDDGFKTVYAHLNGYAKGLRQGVRVRQGQVIAYVGSTGRATGPHLHYEVHRYGKAINPMRLNVATGRQLSGDLLAAFQAERDRIEGLRRTAPFVHEITTAALEPS